MFIIHELFNWRRNKAFDVCYGLELQWWKFVDNFSCSGNFSIRSPCLLKPNVYLFLRYLVLAENGSPNHSFLAIAWIIHLVLVFSVFSFDDFPFPPHPHIRVTRLCKYSNIKLRRMAIIKTKLSGGGRKANRKSPWHYGFLFFYLCAARGRRS